MTYFKLFSKKIWLININVVLLKLLGIFIYSVRNDGHPQKKFHNIYLTKWEFCFNFVKQLRWESQKKCPTDIWLFQKIVLSLWDITLKVLLLKIYREMVAEVARKAHNLEVGGSIPSLATKNRLTTLVVKLRFPIFFYKEFDKLKMFFYLCSPIG